MPDKAPVAMAFPPAIKAGTSRGKAPPACPRLAVFLTVVLLRGLGCLGCMDLFTNVDRAPIPAVLATALAAVVHAPPPLCTLRGMILLNRSLVSKYDAR